MKIQERAQKPVGEFVRRALERYKDIIDGIILFCPVARVDAGDVSDIDISVILRGNESEGWRSMMRLSFDALLDIAEYISVKDSSLNNLGVENPVITNVRSEDIKIA